MIEVNHGQYLSYLLQAQYNCQIWAWTQVGYGSAYRYGLLIEYGDRLRNLTERLAQAIMGREVGRINMQHQVIRTYLSFEMGTKFLREKTEDYLSEPITDEIRLIVNLILEEIVKMEYKLTLQ